MDKIKAKLKAKRRCQKAAEIEKRKQEIFNGLDERDKKHGRSIARRFGKERVWNAHKEIEAILFRESYMTALISAAYVLAFDMGFGRKKRLPEVIEFCRWGLITIRDGERSNRQFAEEMKGEYGIDIIKQMISRFEPFIDENMLMKAGKTAVQAEKVSALARRMPDMLNLVAYPLYFQLGFKRGRMMKIIEKMTDISVDILKNRNYEVYRYKILKRTDINILADGNIMFNYSKAG